MIEEIDPPHDSRRVLFVTSAYPSDANDPRGIHVHRLAVSLVESGAEVTVIAPGARSGGAPTTMEGVHVVRRRYWLRRWQTLTTGISGIAPNLRRRPWLAVQVPFLVAALARGVRRLAPGYDIVHSHWALPSGLATVLARTKKPTVVTTHGGDLNLAGHNRLVGSIVRWVLRRTTATVAVSESLATDAQSYVLPGGRVRTIPLGVNPGQPLAHPTDARIAEFSNYDGLKVVFMGSLTPRKSVATLLAAIATANLGTSLATVIVGDGPERTKLETQAQRQRIAGVAFVGAQPPDLAIEWIRAADVLVLPSRSEGKPVVIMEAMALGKAVLASDIPGSRELVQHGVTGMLFPAGDAHLLATCLTDLAADSELTARLGIAGRDALATLGLTAQASAEAHLALYSTMTRP